MKSIRVYDLVVNDDGVSSLMIINQTPCKKNISSAADGLAFLNRCWNFKDMDVEHLYIAGFREGVCVGFLLGGIGDESRVAVSNKRIFAFCALIGADEIVIYHNHPRADADPSEADLNYYESARAILRLVGIEVLNSVVAAPNRWYSSANHHFYHYRAEDVTR